MNFIKKNAMLLGLAGGFILLLSLSIFLLNKKIRQHEELKKTVAQLSKKIEDLRNKKPFPSSQNVEIIVQNAREEEVLLIKSIEILSQNPLFLEPPKEIDGVECKDIVINVLREMAKVLDQNKIKYPERFQFGFERYAGSPPQRGDTPQIQKQLKIVTELINLAVRSHFREIVSVKRFEFEDVASKKKIADLVTDSKSKKPSKASTQTDAKPTHSPTTEPLILTEGEFIEVDQPNYLYRLVPFQLEFWSDADSLRSFLNALAHSQYILIPRILKIENEKKDIPKSTSDSAKSNDASGKSKGEISGSTPKAETNPVVSNKAISTEDMIQLPFVLGEEIIKVGMRIDWLEFREVKPLPADKPEGKPEKKSEGKTKR